VRQVVLKPAGPHYLRNPGASGQAGDHEGGRGDQERVDNYTAVVRVYANWMDWTDRTTRPTHARVHELAVVNGRHVSERTIKRVVAWLHEQKFIGTVTPGMIPRYRPGVPLALDPGNEAAEYILTIPLPAKTPAPRWGWFS
jgi:hypothetical protein